MTRKRGSDASKQKQADVGSLCFSEEASLTERSCKKTTPGEKETGNLCCFGSDRQDGPESLVSSDFIQVSPDVRHFVELPERRPGVRQIKPQTKRCFDPDR